MLKPRAEGNSQSSQRSTVRCLHVSPRPSHKLSARQDHSPGGKHNTATCERDRFPRWEFKCTLICQKSRDHNDSIHPELSRLNKARASPISISHAPLSQKPTAREDPNFEIEIHIPPLCAAAHSQKWAEIIIIPGKLRRRRRTWSGEMRINKILSGASSTGGSVSLWSKANGSNKHHKRTLMFFWAIKTRIRGSSSISILTFPSWNPQLDPSCGTVQHPAAAAAALISQTVAGWQTWGGSEYARGVCLLR